MAFKVIDRLKRRRAPRSKTPQDKGTRQCCACRERAPRDELLRFVIDDKGHAWLDPHLKAPGRGAHLCYSKSCLELAQKRKSFNASFKRPVILPDELSLTHIIVNAQLLKISNLISLARRRGELISGLNMFERSHEQVLLLVLASDMSDQTKENLTRTFRHQDHTLIAQAPYVPAEFKISTEFNKVHKSWIDSLGELWTGNALGALIGKAHRVAIGITEREMSQQLSLEILRISQVLVASSP